MTSGASSRPDPNALPCSDCGHVWFAGERRHDHVDASGQPVTEDDSDLGNADVLCVLCRREREFRHG